MVKCEVIATRVSLVVAEGSVVWVDERQYEIAKQYLKPVVDKKTSKKAKTEE